MDVKKLDLEGVPWTYRGEGNANIVIGLDNELHVLRLSKSRSTKCSQDQNDESDSQDMARRRHHERLCREVDRANNVVKRLVGPELLGAVEIVEISEQQIVSLNEELNSVRPKNRLHKEIGFSLGTLQSDFARIHPPASNRVDYCIELKLKQGWLNKPSDLAGEGGRGRCNFCNHQFLKLKQGKVRCWSSYCPLNIFSGVPERMICALVALLQNPQNNLRVFKNGKLLFGDKKGDLCRLVNEWSEDFKPKEPEPGGGSDSDESFPDQCEDEEDIFNSRYLWRILSLICSALMAPLHNQNSNEERAARSKELFDDFKKKLKNLFEEPGLLSSTLIDTLINRQTCDTANDNNNSLPDCVLSEILFLQSLTQEEPSSVLEVYKKICPTHSQTEAESNRNLVDSASAASSSSSSSCPSDACFASEVWYDEYEVKTSAQAVLTEEEECRIQNFLLSATAKDCSLMIAVSSNEEEANACTATAVEGEDDNDCGGDCRRILFLDDLVAAYSYKVKLGLADMDIKPITCIPKQCVRDWDCDMIKSSKELALNTADDEAINLERHNSYLRFIDLADK